MSNITIRLDDQMKTEAEKLYESFGLSLTSAIKLFITQSTREQAIPFQIRKTDEEKYNEYFNPMMIQCLEEAKIQAEKGQAVHKTLADLERITNR
jgi:DNA-damage-inducible protein J